MEKTHLQLTSRSNTEKMRKYYWAIITMTADWLLFDKD
jgi:hypothetical protein